MDRRDAPSSFRLTMFLTLAAVAACGGSSQSSPDAGDVVNCTNDPRVAAYAPNLSVNSTGGGMKFVLVSSDPAPPAKGTDTWALRVTDTSGQAMSGLSLSAVLFMPDHGHFMPGVWRITFNVASPSDSAVYQFCIPG